MSPFDWWEEALELGVVDTLESGEPGLMSLGVVLPAATPPFEDFCSLLTDDESAPLLLLLLVLLLLLLLLETFCWAIRSCFRNFARRFWNQTW